MSRRKKLLAGERCRGGKTGNRLISQDHRSPIYLPVASGLGTALLRHRTTGYSVPQTGNTPNRPLWITDRQHTLVFTTCAKEQHLKGHRPAIHSCVHNVCAKEHFKGHRPATHSCVHNVCAKEQHLQGHRPATHSCVHNVCAKEHLKGHRPATHPCVHKMSVPRNNRLLWSTSRQHPCVRKMSVPWNNRLLWATDRQHPCVHTVALRNKLVLAVQRSVGRIGSPQVESHTLKIRLHQFKTQVTITQVCLIYCYIKAIPLSIYQLHKFV